MSLGSPTRPCINILETTLYCSEQKEFVIESSGLRRSNNASVQANSNVKGYWKSVTDCPARQLTETDM
ncbi:hypothetical protein J6590_005299 [Homalodisca vitripennis]|nr:hypothetical protein J6590_005299 [Homalodisca vitripennis]